MAPKAGNNINSEPSVVSMKTMGLVTGTKVRVLGTDQWLTSTIYYNDKGRTVQIHAYNMTGGVDVTSNLFDFSGKLLSTYVHHKNPASGTTPDMRFLTLLDYDDVGRITAIRKQVNGEGDTKVIVRKEYNALGQMSKKILGGGIDELAYDYNIRSWLLGVNRDYVKSGSSDNYFGFELGYDNPSSIIPQTSFANPQLNTNVAGMVWRGKNDNIARKYDFVYDQAKRLISADFNQQNVGSTAWSKALVNFSVDNISYDRNGNILAMKQWGMLGGASAVIDDLRYDYKTGTTNKVSYITDASNNPQSTLGDFKEITKDDSQDYWYDDNGNMIRDNNKGIASITYNHLNLPELVTITGKGTIRFYYDAGGKKWRKVVKDSTNGGFKESITDYVSGFEYKNNRLQQIGHEEGRIRVVEKQNAPIDYVYDYFEKDHLGNVRVVLTEKSATSIYAATMESENAARETVLFSNIDNTRAPKPMGYPDDQTSTNKSVARLSARDDGRRIGPSLVLKVMAGDTVKIGVKAFYKSQQPLNNNTNSLQAVNMLPELINAFGGQKAIDGHLGGDIGVAQVPFNTNFYNNDYYRLKEKENNANLPNTPRAYLNFILFDDQLKLVEQNSGVKQVKSEQDQLQTLTQDAMPIGKSGFLYVYVSNESPQDVFFDNIVVAHTSGPVLEETHYYPFGLTMAGISSTAPNNFNNQYKFGGKELNNREFANGDGLEWYSYGMREYDAQVGRFFRVDPITMDYPHLSPYQYAGNDPIKNIDLDGLEPKTAVESWDPVGSHSYANGQKAYLIDNYWVSVQKGEYNNVYQYYEKGKGWQDFTPIYQADINKSRADGLTRVANDLGVGFSTMIFTGAFGLTGGLALQGVTLGGAGMAAGDVAAQIITNPNPVSLGDKFMNVNWASPVAGLFFKNPLAAAAMGSAFDFRLSTAMNGVGHGFDNALFAGKSMRTFLLESAAFGIAGALAGKGASYLGLGSYSALKTMVQGGLNKSGVVTFQFGMNGATALNMNVILAIFQGALADQEEGDDKKEKKQEK